jgi:hypothetical protein
MRPAISNQCLTRVVIDDEGLEVAHLQVVMQRIQQALRTIPSEQRGVIADGLLSFAIASMTERRCRASRSQSP